MVYFLERVRLARLCREMVDIVPLETSQLIQMPYEQIVSLDKRLEDYLSSLPFFFKLDAESRRRSKPLETLYPTIPVMRYSITKAAHSRRCKLHQRFLLRQSHDPRYAYSRRACLESARVVLHGYEDLPGCGRSTSVAARMGMAMHYMHLALAVLVMDLCFNRKEADEAEIKAEVKAAFQTFQTASEKSPLLGRFLASLRDVLEKHKVCLTDSSTLTTAPVTSAADEADASAANFLDDVQMQYSEQDSSFGNQDIAFDATFDEFWEFASQSEPNPDSLSWDRLFSSLDTRPM
jgi:hypothetical protein